VSNSDWNRKNLLFQPKGLSQYFTDTTKLDYHITEKHALSLVWTYYKTTSVPDITNSVTGFFRARAQCWASTRCSLRRPACVTRVHVAAQRFDADGDQ